MKYIFFYNIYKNYIIFLGKSNQAWLSSSALQQFQEAAVGTSVGVVSGTVVGTQPGGSSSPFSELSRRDEGDGRSIAESQCSAGSFKKVNISSLIFLNY